MPKIPVISGKTLVSIFKKYGFVPVSQKGSHFKLRHPDGRVAIIPLHKQLKRGTLMKGILKPNRLAIDDIKKYL